MLKENVLSLFEGCKIPDAAKPARAYITEYLTSKGYEVKQYLPIGEASYGYSYNIEIVAVKGNEVLAIEIDRRIPGSKALTRLHAVNEGYTKIILLRNPAYGFRILGKDMYAMGLKADIMKRIRK